MIPSAGKFGKSPSTVVAPLRRILTGLGRPRLECRHQDERKIVVDVRVHARQRELDWRDPRVAARREQGRPAPGNRVPRAGGVDRGEEAPGERDVHCAYELGILESSATSSSVDRHGFLEIQVVEARYAVGSGQRTRNRVHASQDGRDRIDLARHVEVDSSRAGYSGGTWLLTCGPWYRWS